jgi:hypothetical protein
MGSPVYGTCTVCGGNFQTKKSHLKRRKTCSKTCDSKRKKVIYSGEGNPNYGNKGEKCAMWKGGRLIKHGYVEIYKPDHPMSNKDGYIREHRLVMSEHLGRTLGTHEDVHHIDGNKLNNDSTNLEVMTRSEHTKHHNKNKQIIRGDLGRIVGVKGKEDAE